jgi:hypothetical protein
MLHEKIMIKLTNIQTPEKLDSARKERFRVSKARLIIKVSHIISVSSTTKDETWHFGSPWTAQCVLSEKLRGESYYNHDYDHREKKMHKWLSDKIEDKCFYHRRKPFSSHNTSHHSFYIIRGRSNTQHNRK